MTSTELSKNVTKLTTDASKLFNSLLEGDKTYDFTLEYFTLGEEEDFSLEEIIQDLRETDYINLLPIIEIRDSINGDTIDSYIIKVDNQFITYLSLEDDENNLNTCNFSDINGIEEQLVLLCEMENFKF